MAWLALFLIGVAVADLGHSAKPVPIVPECVGAGVAVALGLAAGHTTGRDAAALVVIVALVVAWGRTVRFGFGRRRAGIPLAVLATGILAGIVAAPWASTGGGAIGRWLEATPWSGLAALEADRALLLLGLLGVQCSTGNVVVRLVLTVTDTVNPLRGPDHDATRTLKGGRLLGPMERLVILGLGMAGQVTAATLVIAAKGLIRWPELRSIRPTPGNPTINEVTEYFLVGSFVSWMVALGALVLV